MTIISIGKFEEDTRRVGHPAMPLLCRILNHRPLHYTFEGEHKGLARQAMYVTCCAQCGENKSRVNFR